MAEGEAERTQGQVTRACRAVNRIWLSYQKRPKMLGGFEQRKDTAGPEKRVEEKQGDQPGGTCSNPCER